MKRAPTRYVIKITRAVEYVAEVEVIATTSREAQQFARQQIEADKLLRETRVVDEHINTTELRIT